MQRLTMRSRSAAAAAARRLTTAAGGSGGSGSGSHASSDPAFDKKDSGRRETFFDLPPPGFDATTHFGFQTVAQELKEGLVAQVINTMHRMLQPAAAEPAASSRLLLQVFHKVADKYDVMNDLMSGGLHRLLVICSETAKHLHCPQDVEGFIRFHTRTSAR
jgi:hypothetical protein